MIHESDLEAGNRYNWYDIAGDGSKSEITIVGFDPLEKKWVAACQDWGLGISHLDEDDFAVMERV